MMSAPFNPKFKITRATLASMKQLAVKNKLDTSRLDYDEVQQVIVIQSLIDLLDEYQIELEIELAIPEVTTRNDGGEANDNDDD